MLFQANCVTDPAWGRKRRETNEALQNATVDIIRLYKEIPVYPGPDIVTGNISALLFFSRI